MGHVEYWALSITIGYNKDKMGFKLNDLEKMSLFECESNCGRDFPKCGNINCMYHRPMNLTLKKIRSHDEMVAAKC